jgi:NAD(P)H-hydrate epimerase
LKILTAAEMREVDERTIARGIPGIILMENAGACVVRYLEKNCEPLAAHRIVVFCGKGNNGGDGFVVARQLFQRRLCAELIVVELFPKEDLKGDAASARATLDGIGAPVYGEIPEQAFGATLVIDAILGTGVRGAASGRALEFIQLVNRRFPHALKIAVDFPSGFPTDESEPAGEFVKADHTITFTALKWSQAMSPSYEAMGRLAVCPIGTPDELCESDPRYGLRLTTVADIARLFAPRLKNSNKGMYGHVLVVAGSASKPGAAAMAGMSVLRAGAGLATVASPPQAAAVVAGACSELMTDPLPQTSTGQIAYGAKAVIEELLKNKTVLAIGPGLGTEEETVALVRDLYTSVEVPMIVDADALNALAGTDLKTDKIRVMTPHPGEMGRLIGKSAKEVQKARLESAEALAKTSGAAIVLKGDRTLIAFPEGETWVNPTGSPAMATGGTGDVLTGMVAGLLAQHAPEWQRAVAAAVWLHGRAGELGARDLGEECLIATDLLRYLPAAMEECRVAGRD